MIEQLLVTNFPSLSKLPELRAEITRISSVHTFSKDEVILREGQYIKVIPLLVDGLVKVYREDELEGEVLLYYIKSGESCVMSMTTLMKGDKSPVKGIIEEDATILVVPADEAIRIANKYPAWNAFIYDLFSSKYEELLHMITTLTFFKKDKLVLEYLQNLAFAKEKDSVSKTHLEIAKDLGSTREVISRILKKLENEGLVKLAQGEIKLLGK